jgi:malate dehydrogenase (oxaloacetate-decarboxylating)
MPFLPTAAYSIHLEVALDNIPNTLGRLATAIGEAGANIMSMGGFDVRGDFLVNDVVANCRDEDHAAAVVTAVEGLSGVQLLHWYDRTFNMHEGGKIGVVSLAEVNDRHDLSMAYTPGVARVCMAIHEDPSLSHELTIRKNTVAVVTDGTAVLGLGDIGPAAAMPVMEGKALLFKEFAGVDAFPICLDVSDPQEIIDTVIRIAPTFGGINLEDIAAPAAFEVEEALRAALDIPVFHDDQHGTAVVVLAALWNSCRLTGREIGDLSVVIAGMGAAGVAVGRILLDAGVGSIVGVDRSGAVYSGRDNLNPAKARFAEHTNPDRKMGTLAEVLVGTDVFIGLSGPGLIDAANLRTMNPEPFVFAMANPEPEIHPEEADGLAAVMATGRSDYPNQINNVLAFPGIFRGALDVGAMDITENMKLAAARAIADSVSDADLASNFVVPSVFDKLVPYRVAEAVAAAAVADGVCRA